MACIERVTSQLRRNGFRVTPQRLAVLEVLHDGGHLSPGEVYERVQKRMPGMTEATVYRTLEFLAENGIIFAARPESGHLAYELAGRSHHHLVCRACGMQVEIHPDLLTAALAGIERESGYCLETGHLTFLGLCPACQGKETG